MSTWPGRACRVRRQTTARWFRSSQAFRRGRCPSLGVSTVHSIYDASPGVEYGLIIPGALRRGLMAGPCKEIRVRRVFPGGKGPDVGVGPWGCVGPLPGDRARPQGVAEGGEGGGG